MDGAAGRREATYYSTVPFFPSAGPRVFAHRGGCALGPENTLLAFDRGLAAGADGLELDVHLSADGVVVVHHDETLERTTNGRGPIAARTAVELARLDASVRQAAGGAAGDPSLTGVPTLREVLRRYPNVPLIVEMKVDTPEMGVALAAEVRRADAVDRVCAAGYGQRCLDAARRALPEMATSASHAEVWRAFYRSLARLPVRRTPYTGYQVPECAGALRVVSPRFIRHARDADLPVQVWTVDSADDMTRLIEWGVEALITNRPDLAATVRAGRRSP